MMFVRICSTAKAPTYHEGNLYYAISKLRPGFEPGRSLYFSEGWGKWQKSSVAIAIAKRMVAAVPIGNNPTSRFQTWQA